MKKQIIIVFLLFLLFWGYLGTTTSLSSAFNQTSATKIELGRYLFYDTRLSYNGTKSCSSCHDPQFAFTDGYRTSAGADGYNVKRNAPSLLNSRYNLSLTWADSSIKSFESQMLFPLFNEHPKELGWKLNEQQIIRQIESVEFYRTLFHKAFPKIQKPITLQNIITAIAKFEDQLVAFGSVYDDYLRGNKKAMNQTAIKGMQLFYSEKLGCGNCHRLTDKPILNKFYNTGLYNIGEEGDYPTADQGLFESTKNSFDKGKFRVPSLRNVMITAPYTHDGTVANIADMIDIYQRGGRFIQDGENRGDGKLNRNKSKLINGFSISQQEKLSLIAFLSCLTDTSFMQQKKILNPFN